MSAARHAVNREWEELARRADEARAAALDDLLAHVENVEEFLGEPLATETRKWAAAVKSRRNELAAPAADGRGRLEVAS